MGMSALKGDTRNFHSNSLQTYWLCVHFLSCMKEFMRWVGHVACMGKGRGVYRILVGMLEGKCRWHDNIKMDLREIGIDGANWI